MVLTICCRDTGSCWTGVKKVPTKTRPSIQPPARITILMCAVPLPMMTMNKKIRRNVCLANLVTVERQSAAWLILQSLSVRHVHSVDGPVSHENPKCAPARSHPVGHAEKERANVYGPLRRPPAQNVCVSAKTASSLSQNQFRPVMKEVRLVMW